jgi:hypothetical protein
MWRWLARLSVGLSLGIFTLLLLLGALILLGGIVVFYQLTTG